MKKITEWITLSSLKRIHNDKLIDNINDTLLLFTINLQKRKNDSF